MVAGTDVWSGILFDIYMVCELDRERARLWLTAHSAPNHCLILCWLKTIQGNYLWWSKAFIKTCSWWYFWFMASSSRERFEHIHNLLPNSPSHSQPLPPLIWQHTPSHLHQQARGRPQTCHWDFCLFSPTVKSASICCGSLQSQLYQWFNNFSHPYPANSHIVVKDKIITVLQRYDGNYGVILCAQILTIYTLNFSEGTKTIIYISCNSTLTWQRWLKSFLK